MKYLIAVVVAVHTAGVICAARAAESTVDLSGPWSFKIDPQDVGVERQWYSQDLPQKIRLPGSLQEQGYGNDVSIDTQWTGKVVDQSWYTAPQYEKYRQPGNVKLPFWLQPDKHYVGAAWYQRVITIPDAWHGKRITLHLERCHWETIVWVDDKQIGSANSLSTPHVYDLTYGPRTRRVTLRVDNRVTVDVGENAHSVSDHTQSNWNGIVGRIELRATDRVWIDDVQVYPNVDRKSARVKIAVGNLTYGAGRGTLTVQAQSLNTKQPHTAAETQIPVRFGTGNRATVELDYPMGDDVQLWDEFQPALYRLDVKLHAETREMQHADAKSATFGMRKLTTKGTQFVLNGRPIFLRGTLECCIFPLTGYPPTDVDAWKRIIGICKAHGLNHMRFHSHCPPKAAFIAADQLGFYFQVECGAWTAIGNGTPIDRWLYEEAGHILREYGNHPSFVLMAYGNEPGGNHKRYLAEFVNHWKAADPRRLYTSAAGWPVIPESQFHNPPQPRIQLWGAGLRSRINASPPETVTDYRDYISQFDVPVVSHEIGQWCVYPDFEEIPKYKGTLKAKNFEIFRDTLTEKHMGDQAHDFLMASGKLQTLCYKEEIESALRTPGFGGFQLLDLHDFPGQGTALVGVLDPFWDSKPYVTPAEYRRFCNATVPLARLSKRTFTGEEPFTADVDVAHFGPTDVRDATVAWRLIDTDGQAVESGRFAPQILATGQVNRVGRIATTFDKVKTPCRLTLIVAIEGTTIENDWDLWVYPPVLDTPAADDVLIVKHLSPPALKQLQSGGKVLLMPNPKSVKSDVAIGFSSIFWNTAWTRGQAPHTLGILCDPDHSALAEFPTEYHSNWQWWELVSRSGAMILDDLPPKLRPIVQVIDTWFNNRRLGLVFEGKVGEGKLLVCSIDLESDLNQRPVARQMRHSLLAYMAGSQFDPKCLITIEQVRALIKQPSALQRLGAKVQADSQHRGYEADRAIDGDATTMWHTSWEPAPRPFPHHLTIDLGEPKETVGLTYLPRQDMTNGRIAKFEVYVSTDGRSWGEAVATGTWANDAKKKQVRFEQLHEARFVKLAALSEVNGQPFASAAEVDVLLK